MLPLRRVLVSTAGPTPNNTLQPVLFPRSPRKAARENMFMAVVFLPPTRDEYISLYVLGISAVASVVVYRLTRAEDTELRR